MVPEVWLRWIECLRMRNVCWQCRVGDLERGAVGRGCPLGLYWDLKWYSHVWPCEMVAEEEEGKEFRRGKGRADKPALALMLKVTELTKGWRKPLRPASWHLQEMKRLNRRGWVASRLNHGVADGLSVAREDWIERQEGNH